MNPIPKPQPAERPQILERRRFLRTALFAGAALASGCKSEKSNTTTTTRIFQNRPFPLGNSSVSLKECSGAEQTATFEVSRPGNGIPDSVTLRIPDSFSVSSSGPMHEIYVESISCSANPQSANVSISPASAPAENAENPVRLFADLPVIGAVIALFGAVAIWITHRRGPEGRDGTILSPKRQ